MIDRNEPTDRATTLARTYTRPGDLYSDASEESQRLIGILREVLNAPKGTPQMLHVLKTVHTALAQLEGLLETPSEEFRALLEQSRQTRDLYEAQLGDTALLAPSASSLKGLLSKHPVWATFARLHSQPAHRLVLTLLGTDLLFALKQSGFVLSPAKDGHGNDRAALRPHRGIRGRAANKSRLRGDLRLDVNKLRQESNPEDRQLKLLLEGDLPDAMVGADWLIRLRRNWRTVVEAYANGGKISGSFQERVHGELNSSAMYGKAATLAGAITHREMSERQWKIALEHVCTGVAEDTWHGVLGLLTLRTSLSLGVLAKLPLAPRRAHTSPHTAASPPDLPRATHLSVESGILAVNAESIFAAAADPQPGMREAQHIVRIRLPRNLHQHLQNRLSRYPQAQTLGDLYPGEVVPNSDSAVADPLDAITGSWARLRTSTALHLRGRGYNALHAALLCCDFRMTPLSKHYYAVVPGEEMCAAEDQLYRDLGFDAPVELPFMPIAYGARVVPQTDVLIQHDRALLAEVERLRPGNRSLLSSLQAFHNAYTRLCGWRLSFLLAMRASAAIALPASLDEASDLWVAFEDKITSSGLRAQPVPFGQFCAATAGLYKAHCKAMAQRIRNLNASKDQFAMRCAAIAQSANQDLLFVVDESGIPRTPRSSDVLRDPKDQTARLPKDVGRKVMENLLREHGLPSSHIDFFLRHFAEGQVRSHVFHCQDLDSFARRLIPAQDAIARELLGKPVAGLRATMRTERA